MRHYTAPSGVYSVICAWQVFSIIIIFQLLSSQMNIVLNFLCELSLLTPTSFDPSTDNKTLLTFFL